MDHLHRLPTTSNIQTVLQSESIYSLSIHNWR